MNWGTKITVLYLGFVALILSLMFTCFGHPSELEYTDYYAREIKYQDQIDARTNADKLTVPIDYSIEKGKINLRVPGELQGGDLKGKISLLRPSDSNYDREFDLQLNSSGHQTISDPALPSGVYKLGINLTKADKNYYKEVIINLK